MAGVILILFVVGLIFLAVMDRWWCLLGAIFRGDSTYLKEDIMDSGICEDKRSQWAPPPPPQPTKLWWNMTPQEREEIQKRRREEWQRQDARRRRKEGWLGPKPAVIIPRPQPRPQPQPQAFDPELNDLVRELYNEIDAE